MITRTTRSEFLDEYFANMIDKTGIENAKFLCLMHPLEGFFGVSFTSSNSPEYWIECKVVEEQYKVEEGYKIELKATDNNFGKETYYQSDFLSLISSGHIIDITGLENNYHIEKVHDYTPVGYGLNVVTTGYQVVIDNK